ncbi:hypothetical protein [Pseudomonas sp. GM74]|uniref:hypothetical protein n=1 Tax=Pseudomonas sp. GM74 TaxID=1144336 RepID=UPI0005184A9E|nr:hypothetical protein [Pseudomonas sp. GM74]
MITIVSVIFIIFVGLLFIAIGVTGIWTRNSAPGKWSFLTMPLMPKSWHKPWRKWFSWIHGLVCIAMGLFIIVLTLAKLGGF